MTKEALHTYVSESKGNESNICQISAAKDGETVYSDHWRGFQDDDAANVNSVTKGIMALLTGIALDQGMIESVGQKVKQAFFRTGFPVGLSFVIQGFKPFSPPIQHRLQNIFCHKEVDLPHPLLNNLIR